MSAVIRSLLILSLSLFSQTSLAKTIEDSVGLESYIDGLVHSAMKKHHSPSGVVLVYKDGVPLISKGYGWQQLARADEQAIAIDVKRSLFRPGSISKLFTWVAVMQLLEQGKLNLDTDVNQYLHQFKVSNSWPGQTISLRHIMTHTTGLEDGALGYLILDQEEFVLPLADALEKYQPKRINPPGKHTAYSNWATALAGLIVANVSGLSFEEYVQRHIFDVLGMKYATFVEPPQTPLNKHIVQAYKWSAGGYKPTPYERISSFAPAGSAAISAEDIIRFASALLNGGEFNGQRILKQETVAQMISEGFSHDPRTRGMGLGFIKRRFGNDGLKIFGHEGASAWFYSHLGISKQEKLIVFASFSGAGGRQVYQTFLAEFYSHYFANPDAKPVYQALSINQLQEYQGDYLPWRASFSKVEALLRVLNGRTIGAITAQQQSYLLYRDTRYQMVDKDLFQELGGYGRIAFQRNSNGTIDNMIEDGKAYTQYYKAPFAETKTTVLLCLIAIPLLSFTILIHLLYKRKKLLESSKTLFYSQLSWSALTLLFFIVMTLSLLSLPTIVNGFPRSISLALILPLLSSCSGAILIAGLVQSLLKRKPQQVTAWLSAILALSTLAFYSYWNLLGFNYFS
ncbi:serine hydrolase domain-containing protein [uncultured Pseudoteredinibacter sp.]|uniref:serine hydrolase domain-containing protein n=1 Tax=uncultured Pseudoteredinibacter sp. TaxID=1641701 RepID=UPI00261D048E|nr:serine hydrolase domain-containing protein [uncultured Pseudoteredinibacter sp.]